MTPAPAVVVGLRRRPWAAPAGTAVLAAAGCSALALADPSASGGYPLCPFRALTGLWCPACGSTRALHALLHGDLVVAAGFNLLLLVALPVVGYAWVAWASPRFGGPALPRPRIAPAVWYSLLAAALAFGVVRNLPGVPLLP